MEETTLYDLPKDMLIKLIMTIQDCKNLNNDDLIRNSNANMLEVEKRKLEKIKEFLLKEDLQKVLNLSKLIKDIIYIRVRVLKEIFTVRMRIIFKDGVSIGILQVPSGIRMSLYDKNNNKIDNNIPDFNNGKYNDRIILYRELIFPYFQKLYNYLYPFTSIDPF